MLFDIDLKELATQATNKHFQYEFANFKSKGTKNDTALSFIEKTKAGLTDFNLALDSIRYNNGGVVKNKVAVSQANIASAEIKDYGPTDSVSLFVTQLASAHEIALDGLDDAKVLAEKNVLKLKVGATELDIDFSKIDTVGQLAQAINQHGANNNTTSNDNLVSATIRRINGAKLLVLKSNNTGEANKIEFTAAKLFSEKEITKAQDAKVKLGGESSVVEVTNSSNTFDELMEKSSITLVSVHKSGDTPLTIKIEQDTSASEALVNNFADAFNKILEVVKYDKDNPNPYTSGLHSKIYRLPLLPINGKSLHDFGFTFDKQGLLKVDNKKLQAEISKDPTTLNDFFKSKDGLITKLDALLNPYLMGDEWSLDIEEVKLNENSKKLAILSEKLQDKYDQLYSVNLNKMQEMERVMEQMEGMLNMFDFEDKNK